MGGNPESILRSGAMAYDVYLLASGKHGTLYVGVTRDFGACISIGPRPRLYPATASDCLFGLKVTTTGRLPSPAKRKSRNGGAIGRLH
jgi:hypothetical protein